MYAVIRIRGSVNIRREHMETMKMLRLNRVNHLVLIPEEKQWVNMVKKVQPYVTYGEVEAVTVERLVKKRARLMGDKKLDAEFLKKHKFKSFKELAEALISGKVNLKQIDVKPVFRLSPPSKGYERGGIKKGYSSGGASGYRAHDINQLIKRMT